MEIQTPINDIVATMTCDITITGMRAWRLRVALGKWLMILGARVIGMKTEVNFR